MNTPSKDTRLQNWIKGGGVRDSEMVANRSAFVEEFGIVKFAENETVWQFWDSFDHDDDGWIDHRHCFKTRTGKFVFVTSPYNTVIPELASALGFKPYALLYHHNATTFVAHFENLNAVRWAKMVVLFLRGEKQIKTPTGTLGVFLEERL